MHSDHPSLDCFRKVSWMTEVVSGFDLKYFVFCVFFSDTSHLNYFFYLAATFKASKK